MKIRLVVIALSVVLYSSCMMGPNYKRPAVSVPDSYRGLVEFQSRLLVFIQWGFQYLTFSRGARLITGSAPSDYSQQGSRL